MKNKILEIFQPLSIMQTALRELENAQRALLEAQSAAEYSKNIVEYNLQRIARLQAFTKVLV